MKKSTLIGAKEKLMSKSKKPWAVFETDGFGEEGLGVTMYWNYSFIKHLADAGIQGKDDQETLQMFFLFMANRISDGLIDEETVNPEAMPTLTSEANTLVR